MKWKGEAFETAAYAGGCVVSLMRSRQEWLAHPQAKALKALPVITIERIGEAVGGLVDGHRAVPGVGEAALHPLPAVGAV